MLIFPGRSRLSFSSWSNENHRCCSSSPNHGSGRGVRRRVPEVRETLVTKRSQKHHGCSAPARIPFPTWKMTSVLSIFLRRCHRRTEIRAAAAAAVLFLDTTLLCDRRLGPGCGPGLWARESTMDGTTDGGSSHFFLFSFLFLFFASAAAAAAVAFRLLYVVSTPPSNTDERRTIAHSFFSSSHLSSQLAIHCGRGTGLFRFDVPCNPGQTGKSSWLGWDNDNLFVSKHALFTKKRRASFKVMFCTIFFFLCPTTPRQKFPHKETCQPAKQQLPPTTASCIPPSRIPPQGQRKGGAAAMRHTKTSKGKKTRRWLGRLTPHARCDWSPARLEGVKGAHHPPVLLSPLSSSSLCICASSILVLGLRRS